MNDPAAAKSPGFDPTMPNTARIYDYWLGGKDNFAADREAAEQAIAYAPDIPRLAREARKFLDRAVRFLAAGGIRQFIDIGTGLPTQGHVHEVLRVAAPVALVAYVDNDPVVLAHGRALLAGSDRVTVIEGDVRDPEGILGNPQLTELIDLDRPKLYQEGPLDGPRRPDLRTRQDVLAFFDGMELIEPGVVKLPAWRPEHDGRKKDIDSIWVVGGVARKP